MICSQSRPEQMCQQRALALRDGDMVKNYRHGRGWSFPVDRSKPFRSRYAWTFCPFCGQDLPPIVSDEAMLRMVRDLLRPESSQADGEGEE